MLGWNADFDERILRQTASQYGLQWKNKYRLHDRLLTGGMQP